MHSQKTYSGYLPHISARIRTPHSSSYCYCYIHPYIILLCTALLYVKSLSCKWQRSRQMKEPSYFMVLPPAFYYFIIKNPFSQLQYHFYKLFIFLHVFAIIFQHFRGIIHVCNSKILQDCVIILHSYRFSYIFQFI